MAQLRLMFPGVADSKLDLVVFLVEFHLKHSSTFRRKVRMMAAKEEGTHTPAQWRSVLARHGHRCALCGTKSGIAKDHIVPVSKGGSDAADNLQPLCGSCNSSKRDNL